MLLESHLFYLPLALREHLNIRDYHVGSFQATYDDAPDFVFRIAASQKELISLADIRFICDLIATKPNDTPLTTPSAMSEAGTNE